MRIFKNVRLSSPVGGGEGLDKDHRVTLGGKVNPVPREPPSGKEEKKEYMLLRGGATTFKRLIVELGNTKNWTAGTQ